MTIFFIGDTHFNHKYMLHRGTRKKFDTMEEHDEHIVAQWNSIVKPADTVYHLGDVGVGESSSIMDLIDRCNGKKILILGNHDYLNILDYVPHFENIHGVLRLEKFWISHVPLHPQEFFAMKWNIHGHIHDSKKIVPDDRYICVSIDMLPDMRPISFEEVKDRITS